MRVMLRASYKRCEKGKKPGKPELISAEYGEVPDELIMGQWALALRDAVRMKEGPYAAQEIQDAIERAKADGVLMTL